MTEAGAVVKIDSYLIRRGKVAYTKVEDKKSTFRVVIVFTSHCSDILMNRPTMKEAEELALAVMVGNEYLI